MFKILLTASECLLASIPLTFSAKKTLVVCFLKYEYNHKITDHERR
ncbi:hypothetical protein EJK54_0388 [Moraxella catarrhalis]|uniref:Uncharacterized protein n=1 Tax=Moraxella catarrhalis TaxID=480 RepID=A0ABY0BIQ0_MORCA|nr:hypothetical protein EJK54_0388 [Moraxella catarrhalis]